MASKDRIVGILKDHITDENIANAAADLFISRNYEPAIMVVKNYVGRNYDAFLVIESKIFLTLVDERLFNLICREMCSAAADIRHIDFHNDSRYIAKFFRYIYSKRKRMPQSVIITAARCLEYLWAYGATGIEKLIANLYQFNDLGVQSELTELYLRKELSIVYILDGHNEHAVRQRLYDMRERIKSGKHKNLKALFHYYMALSLRFEQTNYVVRLMDGFDVEMEKSLKRQCELAQIYMIHRNKLRNFDEA